MLAFRSFAELFQKLANDPDPCIDPKKHGEKEANVAWFKQIFQFNASRQFEGTLSARHISPVCGWMYGSSSLTM